MHSKRIVTGRLKLLGAIGGIVDQISLLFPQSIMIRFSD